MNAIKVENTLESYRFNKERDPFSTSDIIQSTSIKSNSEVEAKRFNSRPVEFNPKEINALDPLQTEYITLRFTDASSIAQLLEKNSGRRLLSEQGSLAFDERTNTIILKEQPENLKEIMEIIRRLDVPVRQVQIEARIAIINEGDIEELGVRWGISSKNNNLTIGGSIDGISGNELRVDGSTETDISDYLNVNLGSTSENASSIAFQIAKLSSSTLLDLELSALQSESRAEVISSPRLLTMNKKPAYIEQGTEIPYLESSESGAATVRFRKAVLSLEVTPQMIADNKIILDLLVTQDRPGQIVKTGTGEAVAIDTQRIDTQVIVKNGETVVLGGIFQTSNIRSIDKVPLLGDIPVLGNLFKRSYENEMKRELLIFVTPTIVDN
ncbi:type IV pilus secretin PilQ [Vibrio sp. kj40-1]|uniref:Type IV pilus secretin PilQ n=1 Tax=Vibrio algarum TaxID=3020714 RepID=A0ABT4YLE6_9VIBR|nr:type IV pilus secretin PilQ [Vibrio sp. KJ40-1]